ncbi:hypothetical protein [Pseudomonas lopnurensis]|uniref:hypothetical protein n=1 Tax=Pseudomonas lopnurensis TaxID=1477517 RepID=UPI001879D23C|nr:hypothetical protein [Pseudomonas lopnurensis]MBE7373544.1 hypothetical protein [Pseudomonas lopnurensis]
MKKGLPREMRTGGFLDISTVKGNIFSIAVVLLCCFAIWNFHYFSFWLDSVLGFEHVPATEGMIRVRRFWAGLAAGTMVLAGAGNIVWLCWYRKQAIKSAKGQWYDNADLTKEDLYGDEGNQE